VRSALKEAASETRRVTYSNRIRGGAEQGERASDLKALAINAQAT